MEPVRIDFLGSGTAFSDGGRHHSAYMIKSPRGSLLLDCGPTTLASLKRHDLPTEPINQVLLSHLHGDHFAGLPFLFLEYVYVEPRNRPLVIAGPPGIEESVRTLFQAMYPDAASEPLPYHIVFVEAVPDRRFWFGDIEVNPFRVPHQDHPVSLGFELLVDKRKIIYTGDSGWTEDLIARTQGADLLICECTFFETRLDTHMDYPRIWENRERFGAKRIVLTHLGQEMLQRRHEIDLELAYDGLTIIL
jgi:ribonuclease BN (tRNA processing enzyme)